VEVSSNLYIFSVLIWGDSEFKYQSGPVFGLVLIYKENGIVTRKYVPMVVKKVGAHTGYQSCVYTKFILQIEETLAIARGKKKIYVTFDFIFFL